MSASFVMTEHPSWRLVAGTQVRVLTTDNGGVWLAEVGTRGAALTALQAVGRKPRADTFSLAGGSIVDTPGLLPALQPLGTVARYRNPSLWDALATAIIRQVIRAAQAKKLYRAFCDAYGERAALPGDRSYMVFPRPQTVLALTADQFGSVGMAFKRRPLQRAAEAFISDGEAWARLSPAVLDKQLQTVPGIGAWTAGAAVADWSNDWSLYPYADLAVRTWAKRAAPSFAWPTDEPAFGRLWQALAGDQLSTLTLLTLAWGSQHGDIG